jgi:hypothetical protein
MASLALISANTKFSKAQRHEATEEEDFAAAGRYDRST